MKVGWIGLGQIGTAMAEMVLAGGHEFIGHTRRAGGREALIEAGAALTGSLVEVAESADFLGVCVFNDAQVREVLLESGALARMRPGSVAAVHTTGSPRLAEELAAAAPDDVGVLDVTFSGSAEQARTTGVTLMVGGQAGHLARARPVLETYGERIVHVGPVGAGQRLKLVNNTLFAAQVQLALEALRLVEAGGIGRETAVSTLMTCSGASFALGLFGGEHLPEEVTAGLTRYLDKDVETARAAARDAGLDLGALGMVTQAYGPSA